MANYVGPCAQCGVNCDRDDDDVIVVIGDVDSSRLYIVACSLDHLARWAAKTSAQSDSSLRASVPELEG